MGLTFSAKSNENQEWYIVVKPKPIQNYLPELEVDNYTYNSLEFEKLNLNDCW